MPKKKAKKGKKKSKKSSDKDSVGDVADLNIDGDGAQLGISKKKKGKKAKLSKEEKAAAKIAKKLEKFIQDDKLYENFLQKIDHWMITNKQRVEELFKNFDQDGEGVVPFEVFRSGMHDLLCPLTELELYAFAKKLDPEETGFIEYCGYERGIHNRVVSDDEEEGEKKERKLTPEDYSPALYQTNLKPPNRGLNDPFNEKHARYINLNMILATFDSVRKHTGHFTTLVRSHMEISTLLLVIAEIAKITSGQLQVYSHRSCKAEHRLPRTSTLEECGLIGGSLRHPQAVTLYYDYVVEFSDCPLLNCDIYFGIEKRPLNPVLTAYPPRERKKKEEV